MGLTRTLAAVLAPCALVFAGCTGSESAEAATTAVDAQEADAQEAHQSEAVEQGPGAAYPGDEWETIDATGAGLDQAVLDSVAADAEAGLSNCLLVTRGGKLVGEWYWQGTGPGSAQEVFSASKSFTATLVGMAVDGGFISLDDEASEWIPEWRGTASEHVTVEHLLNNTSGRFQDFETDYVEMAARAEDKTEYSIDLDQQHEPGSTWVYNNAAIQTLEQVFGAATGEDMSDFAAEALFSPLGMDDSELIRDRAGNPLTFMGVQSTCRDMARFGLLALRQGDWDGQQVVSQEWMQLSTGRSSQKLNAAYGLLWWLNRPGVIVAGGRAVGDAEPADPDEQLVEGAPQDMFFASGMGGQTIAVDPGSDTVVVRLGPSVYPEGLDKFDRSDIARVATEAVTGEMTD